MSKQKKKKIYKEYDWSNDNLRTDVGKKCTILEFIEALQSLHNKESTTITLGVDESCGEPMLEFVYIREETDDEYEKRLPKEQKEREKSKKIAKSKKEKKAERDRKEFERLKKLFGEENYG